MIWVVGASGMLGKELCGVFKTTGLDYVGSDREVDFRDQTQVEAFAKGKKIDWLVNCAAYTAVDKAEDEKDLAQSLNVKGPEVLARWAQKNKVTIVHISTDYVFSGLGSKPYAETDPVDPQSVYGTTKEMGEQAIRRNCDNHFIFRTAWLYGINGPNFVATMLRLINEKPAFGVVNDQWGAPTWAYDLAQVITHVIKTNSIKYGTYHASGEGQITWYNFACEILTQAKAKGLVKANPQINPLTTEQYPTKAKRPIWSVLSKNKLNTELGLTMPNWKISLEHYLNLLKEAAL